MSNAPATPTPTDRPRIALIAHDRKKDVMVELAKEFVPYLRQCRLMATGTTGGRLVDEVGLEVERMLSGPWGGDLQIGARLAVGEVDAVVFLRDPMTPQPQSLTSTRWCGPVMCTTCRAQPICPVRACCWRKCS
jgi:methylglyoxal synthase